jgi:hypothetical protein
MGRVPQTDNVTEPRRDLGRRAAAEELLPRQREQAEHRVGPQCLLERDELAEALLDLPLPARAGNRRFGLLSALRARTKAPYKIELLRKREGR